MISKKNFALVLVFTSCGVCSAGGLADLDVFLKTVESGTLNFTQNIVRKKFDGAPRNSESKARLEFHRPHSFRLEYAPPNDYVFAADGVKLIMHDPILNTTIVHDQSSLMGKELIALIGLKTIEILQKDYELREESVNGFDWAIATHSPKKEVIFSKISFGFQRNELTRLETVDGNGDRSTYRISWESLEAPAPSRFKFLPPAGSDYEDKSESSEIRQDKDVTRE